MKNVNFQPQTVYNLLKSFLLLKNFNSHHVYPTAYSPSSKIVYRKSWLQLLYIMKEVKNEPVSLKINRNHFCPSFSHVVFRSNYQLCRIKVLERYPPKQMVDSNFLLSIVNNKLSFSIVLKGQKINK